MEATNMYDMLTIEEVQGIIETEELIESTEILGVYEIELDYTKVYAHDEILGYIYAKGGTFNMIYEIESLSHAKNMPERMTVGAINVWIEYEGVTYECDHLWFNTDDCRDEVIRISRVQTRRKGGVRGLVRELHDVEVTTYKGKEGNTRYCIYKEPAEDGPGNFVITTLAHKKEQSMNTMEEQFRKLGLLK